MQGQLKGGKASVIVEKDLRGDLHLQESGVGAGKGATSGAVLGVDLGVLTGGASLALAALGGGFGGVEGKRARDGSLSANLLEQISAALAPGASAILIAGEQPLPEAIQAELRNSGAELFSAEVSRRVSAHSGFPEGGRIPWPGRRVTQRNCYRGIGPATV